MSGSIKWFIYEADSGAEYAYRADESNTEAIGAGGQDYGDSTTTPLIGIPSNLKPRTLRYVATNGRSKTIICPTLALFANPTNPITPDGSGGDSFRLKSVTGEKFTAPLGFDTGLQDGDAT